MATAMGVPLAFLYRFRDLLREAGIRSAITSGMACVYYGLQQTTKDSDWIVAPDDLDKLRALLQDRERSVPPWRVQYRTIFGAPLDPQWLRNGWTSHLAIRDQALAAEHHLDFFAKPPRVRSWQPDPEGFADRDVVAMMKRTDRDKDWPIVDGLGWQLHEPERDVSQALVHIQDAGRLRRAWGGASVAARAAASARRPLLCKVDAEPDDHRLEGWIRLERLVWQCINRARYGAYQSAWKGFYRRWRAEPDWSWPTSESFSLQHRRLVAAAERHALPVDPLAALDRRELMQTGVAQAATLSLTSLANAQEVAPPLDEVLP